MTSKQRLLDLRETKVYYQYWEIIRIFWPLCTNQKWKLYCEMLWR